MNVGSLGKVENPDFYLDVAFRRANKLSSETRSSVKGARIDKSKKVELKKVEVAADSLIESLSKIVFSFPSIDQLSEFYVELLKATVGVGEFRKALAGVNWSSKKVREFQKIYSKKIVGCRDLSDINKIRRSFYGRVSSLLKQLKSDLAFLESARRTLKGFPVVKPKLFTVGIAGFPNIGKTTLLHKLTGSKPEIAAYAFTTKGINVGYIGKGKDAVQFLDTPGSLNRFNKMNVIEKQAYLALKYCANVIVYVFDLSEPFPLSDQKKLFVEVKRFDKPTLVYLSKTDIVDEEIVKDFCKSFDCITSIDSLKKKLLDLKSSY